MPSLPNTKTSPMEYESILSNSNVNLSSPNTKYSRRPRTLKIRATTFKSAQINSDGRINSTYKNNLMNNESISKKRMSRYNAQKSLKDLHTILYIKRNARKLAQMSHSISLKKLNQYHLNLIGDKTCKILNKTSANYTYKFQNMISSLVDDNSERFDLYDEMMNSMSPAKRMKTLKNSKFNFLDNLARIKKIVRTMKRFLLIMMRFMKYIKVIRPDSVYKLMIDIFSLGIILFCIFFIPIHNIFWVHQGLYSDLILVLIIVQLLLLIMSMNVGYISNGIIFTNRKLIFARFLGLETLSDIIYLVLLFQTWSENDDFDLHFIKSTSHLILSSVMLFLLIFKFSGIFTKSQHYINFDPLIKPSMFFSYRLCTYFKL